MLYSLFHLSRFTLLLLISSLSFFLLLPTYLSVDLNILVTAETTGH
jgi:hypothetical protein